MLFMTPHICMEGIELAMPHWPLHNKLAQGYPSSQITQGMKDMTEREQLFLHYTVSILNSLS